MNPLYKNGECHISDTWSYEMFIVVPYYNMLNQCHHTLNIHIIIPYHYIRHNISLYRAADYFQFMKYPSNPKTNLKDEYEALKKQRDEEMEWEKRMAEKREKGREEYLNQLKQLSGARGADGGSDKIIESSNQRRRWFGWFRGWKQGNKDDMGERTASS